MLFFVLTSIAVNVKNIHQGVTEILPFDLNHDFSHDFFTCDCGKMEINANHGIKENIAAFFPKIEFLTCRVYANAFILLVLRFEHFEA